MKETDFAYYLRDFLSKYLPGQRNLSTNTIVSYRDAFKLFLIFCETAKKKKANLIDLAYISRETVVEYLVWLEEERGCSISTRNQRLAALRSFFHYVSTAAPETLLICQKILNIPMKKNAKGILSYFSPEGLHLLLKQPDTSTQQGRRDHALLVFLYDSGARVQELADLCVRDLRLEEPATVTLKGKGRKMRIVPISAKTASILKHYLREKDWLGKTASLDFPVFSNNRKFKLSRAGISYILKKYVEAASKINAGLIPQIVSPHCLRHSKAVHLLRSGVPLIYIRDFLGHASVTTTEIYAKVDAEDKRKALESTYEIPSQKLLPDWENDKGLMGWLIALCQ
ncbi:MAG: site-specific integrase [Deltaproteobacteria bacterium]|nr:site-specific integrase [Deltaproteobacteria bacterium]